MNTDGTPDPTEILFTLEGRKHVRDLLKPLDLLMCERGFLDHSDGTTLTDRNALEILQARASAGNLAEATALNDRAEAMLDLLFRRLCDDSDRPTHNEIIRAGEIGLALKGARVKAGRPTPKAE